MLSVNAAIRILGNAVHSVVKAYQALSIDCIALTDVGRGRSPRGCLNIGSCGALMPVMKA